MRRGACDRRMPAARCAAVAVSSARAAVGALPGTRPRACGTLFRNLRATVLAAPGARVSSGCSPAGRLYLTPEVRNGRPGRRDRPGHGQSRFAAGPRAALQFRGRARRDRRTRRGIAGALRRLAERSSGAACAAREGRPYRARVPPPSGRRGGGVLARLGGLRGGPDRGGRHGSGAPPRGQRPPALRLVATVTAPAGFRARRRPVRDSLNAPPRRIRSCRGGRSWPSISEDWRPPRFVEARAVAASVPYRGAASRQSRARPVSSPPPVQTGVRVQYGHCPAEDLADQPSSSWFVARSRCHYNADAAIGSSESCRRRLPGTDSTGPSPDPRHRHFGSRAGPAGGFAHA